MVDAKIILTQLYRKYGECQSYSDFGVMWEPGRSGRRIEFMTHFIRPDKFRFEWKTTDRDERKYAIWCNSAGAYECYHFNDYKTEHVNSLLLAVAGATGISKGTAHRIHSLLLPAKRNRNFSLRTGRQLSLGRGASVMNEYCAHLQIVDDSEIEKDELWIGRQSFKLRKIRKFWIITVKDMREHRQSLQNKSPEIYNRFKNEPIPDKDRIVVTECRYSSVEFDKELDDKIFFSGSFNL